MLRKNFEEWISKPPIEASINRFPFPDNSSWAGQYRNYSVQLAWEAWIEAKKQSAQENKDAKV